MTPSVNSIEDAFDRLRRVRWLIVTATLVFGVVGVVMAFTTGKYSASSVLIVQRADTNLLQALSSDVGRMRFNGPDAFIEKFLVYLNSRSFHEAAFADLLHDKNYSRIKKVLVQPRLQQILERLQVFGLPVTISDDAIVADPNVAGSMAGSMRVMRSDSNTIVVTVTTSNREVSALLANIIANSAVTHTILRELKESDEAQSYILEKIAEIGSRIDTLRSEMTSLSKDRASMPAIEGAHMSGSERLQADIQTTKLRLDANRKTIARLTEQIATKNHAIGDAKPVDHGDLAASLSHQLDALRFRKRSLVAQGTSPAAAVSRGLDAEIDDTARRLDELRSDGQLASMATDVDDASPQDLLHELQVESVKLGDFLDSANKMYQGLLAKESTLPESQQRRISLIKRTEVEHTLLAELTKQLFQLDVHKISVKNKIAILEIAVAEESLRSPSIKSATIMGLTFGGIMSLFLAMTIERRHPTVIGRQDLESLNFRHVGTIPRLKFRRKSKRKLIGLSDSFGGAAFANASQYGAFVVLIKYIRTRIVRIAGPRDGGARVISVHSAMPGEGKTLVAMGMANSLASLRQRVLFLDSDVLGSRLRSLVPGATPGLVGVLANEASPEEVVLRDVLPFLDFMPPGNRTSVSTELLIGGRFAELIVQLKARYDYIIIDTPPVNIVPDSTIIAAAADIVVYVVSCHQTKVSQVEEALANLTFATDKPVQLIVNRATKAAISSGNYNYGVSPRSKAVDVIGKVAS